MPGKRVTSVLELARYKVGDCTWWVTLRHKEPVPTLSGEDEWMTKEDIHPKTLYEHGPYKSKWSLRAKLPRLQHMDFAGIVGLLMSELVVERFDVCDVVRSNDTGEFYYSNRDDEWMPESYLFDTDVAARRERTRVVKMVRRWAGAH